MICPSFEQHAGLETHGCFYLGNVEGEPGPCELENPPCTEKREEGEPSGAGEPDRPGDSDGFPLATKEDL